MTQQSVHKAKRWLKWMAIAGMSVIVILSLVALTGCGTPAELLVSGPPKDDGQFTVAIFYYSYKDAYINSVRKTLSKDLTKAGINYQEYDANNDQSSQDSQIDAAIAADADLLLVNFVTSGNTEKADLLCQKAKAAGIPVVFFNRPVEGPGYEGVVLNYYDNVAYVGTDSEEAGRMQGQIIGDYLVEHFKEVDLNHDGKISYVQFKGQASNTGANARTHFSVEVANEVLTNAGHPKLSYFDSSSVDAFQLDLTGSWSSKAAQEYMLSDLMHYNEKNKNMIELVIANSDSMAEGAILALQSNGYNLGTSTSKTIPVFGVDASANGKRLIADGIMAGTVAQDPSGMAHCISLMVGNVSRGEDLFAGTENYDRNVANNIPSNIVLHYSIYDPSTYAGTAEAQAATSSKAAQAAEKARADEAEAAAAAAAAEEAARAAEQEAAAQAAANGQPV